VLLIICLLAITCAVRFSQALTRSDHSLTFPFVPEFIPAGQKGSYGYDVTLLFGHLDLAALGQAYIQFLFDCLHLLAYWLLLFQDPNRNIRHEPHTAYTYVYTF
jgi:hypothetical protein